MNRVVRWCWGAVERCLGGREWDGVIWQREHAQFSIAVAQANSSLEDQSQVFQSPSATYIGVYDGHGGPQASRFLTKRLLSYLHKLVSEEGGVVSVDAIKKAFSATEEEFLHLVKRCVGMSPHLGSVGSCCLVGAISNGVLYVANLGDSRAVLGSKTGRRVVAERLSVDHNVADEEVRKEVEALHPDDSHIVLHTRGVWRIKGIIQVSRSIGDVFLKRPDFCRHPVFHHFATPIPLTRPLITADPSITVRQLRPQDLFIIFASDGLWEQLTDEAAVDIVSKYPRAGIAKTLVRAALRVAAKKKDIRYDDLKKIDMGARRNFHDDITVVVIYLDHHHKGSSNNHSAVGCTTAPIDMFSSNEDEAEHCMLAAVA